jgi:hypothetical protein
VVHGGTRRGGDPDQPPGRAARVGAVDEGPHRPGQGIIMQRFGVDDVQAFEMLRRLSQDSNTRLIEVAKRVIDTRGNN